MGENVISGLVGSVITAVITFLVFFFQMRSNNKTNKYSNLLKLKELFDTEKRYIVFLFFEGKADFPSEPDIYDYLGTYELAYSMYLDKQVSEYEFFNTYCYRILDFCTNDLVFNMINEEYSYWERLLELILENLEWALKTRRIAKDEYFDLKQRYLEISKLSK